MSDLEKFKERVIFKDVAVFGNHIKLGIDDAQGTPENIIWDYKFGIAKDDPEKSFDLAKDICAFANTYGGTVLIGVSEKMNTRNERTAHSINNQSNPEEIKKFINNTVLPIIHPELELDIFSFEIENKGTIVAVNVAPTLSTMSSVDSSVGGDHRIIFPYRTYFGNKFHSAENVKNMMSKNIRQSKYLLKKYCVNKPAIDIGTPVFSQPNNPNENMFLIRPEAKVTDFLEDYCEVFINNYTLHLPYEFIETIWPMANGKIGIFLKVFIVIPRNPQSFARIIPSQTVGDKFLV